MPLPVKYRKPVKLRKSTQCELTKYALAASAAGVGILAMAQPAAAEIVYTGTHQTIPSKHAFALDLNQDGKVDFAIENVFRESRGLYLYVHWKVQAQPAVAAAIETSGRFHYGAALKKGAEIGPQGPWRPRLGVVEGEAMEFGYTFSYGYWNNDGAAYLGLRFQIDGEDHYGWVRLTVQWTGNELLAEVSGYAYETVANQPILAGDTGGADAANEGSSLPGGKFGTSQPDPEFSTLGALALGSSRLTKQHRP